MFAIGLNYIRGCSLATDVTDRERAEWPPHPDRVYMALAAAHFETDGDEAERNALLWLERQPAPTLSASNASTRSVTTSYVPVNDTTRSSRLSRDTLTILPEARSRQPRQFPVVIPHDPEVYFVWDTSPDSETRGALRRLCQKVTHIGHSASMVQAWVEESPPSPTLVPTPSLSSCNLRVPGTGRLDNLSAQYEMNLRPERARYQGYELLRPENDRLALSGAFDGNLLILERSNGRRMGLESTLLLTQSLRNAMLKRCPQPVPEWVSGHTLEGNPTKRNHVALLPIPFVGHEHADGHVMGLAFAIPANVDEGEMRRCFSGILGFHENPIDGKVSLYQGELFEWELRLNTINMAHNLQSSAWTEASTRWSSVTPMVMHRFPKTKDREAQIEEMVRSNCAMQGLPEPAAIVSGQASRHIGVPASRNFPALMRGQKRHYHQHVTLRFDEPVRGPILLGLGRFRGYGFFRPVTSEERTHDGN